MFRHFMQSITERQRARRTFDALSELNADQLRDIGLTREDARRFARQGALFHGF